MCFATSNLANDVGSNDVDADADGCKDVDDDLAEAAAGLSPRMGNQSQSK